MTRARGRAEGARRARTEEPTPGRSTIARLVRRLGVPAVVASVVVAAFVLGIFPTRTYLEKQREIAAAESRLAELKGANARAQERVDALQTDAEIERLAREQYGLAKPGEETYRVLPPPQPAVQIPDSWPFNRLRPGLPSSRG